MCIGTKNHRTARYAFILGFPQDFLSLSTL